MDALVGLAALKLDDAVTIHVSTKSDFVLQWLALVGIPEDRVVTGTIFASVLVVPEMGKCGTPFPCQLEWLNSQMPRASSPRKVVILVKRTKSRTVRNFEAVEMAVRESAKMWDVEVHVHDDSKLLSVRAQLEMFSGAAAVIAPHGAGLVNLIAVPRGIRVIEFIEDLNVCFLRVAAIRGLDHSAVRMRGGIVDMTQLKARLALPAGGSCA
jgi:hypothetical protein